MNTAHPHVRQIQEPRNNADNAFACPQRTERTEVAPEQRTAALLAAQVEVRPLEKAQAEGHVARQALEAEVSHLKAEAAARDREFEKVREGFSRDLANLRETAERAEECLRATEKRALLETDRERSAVVKPAERSRRDDEAGRPARGGASRGGRGAVDPIR
ncbi:hypothetical protein [Paraburkholderia sp. BL10I2N1]|uniref:hypothetical protein n=1 Tax=Paraburkholderia sp. BL10I2N1 TaxID=1938796 RepID=UPI00267C32C6